MFHYATEKLQSSSEASHVVGSTIGILFYSEIVASCLFLFLILRLLQLAFRTLMMTLRKIISAGRSGTKVVGGLYLFRRYRGMNME